MTTASEVHAADLCIIDCGLTLQFSCNSPQSSHFPDGDDDLVSGVEFDSSLFIVTPRRLSSSVDASW